MLCRAFRSIILALPLIVVLCGCDNRPKIIMPDMKAPPAPRPHVGGGGDAGPAEPAVPAADPNAKKPASKQPPADSTPEDKK
jgi:hypothetical protein